MQSTPPEPYIVRLVVIKGKLTQFPTRCQNCVTDADEALRRLIKREPIHLMVQGDNLARLKELWTECVAVDRPGGVKTGSVCHRILNWFLNYGKPATCAEIARQMGLPVTTVHRNLRENTEIFVVAGQRHDGYRPRPLFVAWEE